MPVGLPQNLATVASPTFAGLTITGSAVTGDVDGLQGIFKGPIPHINVMHPAFNVSGSVSQTTLAANLTTSSTTPTLTAAIDFVNGQGIAFVLDNSTLFETTIVSGAGTTTPVLAAGPPSQASSSNGVYHSDTVGIQAALDFGVVSNVSPTLVFIPEGTYCISTLKLNSQQGFVGGGIGVTRLVTLPYNTQNAMIQLKAVTTNRVFISDMRIVGNTSVAGFPTGITGATADGIRFDNTGHTGSSPNNIRNVDVITAGGDGLSMKSQTYCRIHGMYIDHPTGMGVNIDANTAQCSFVDVAVDTPGTHGFSELGHSQRFTNCNANGAGHGGVSGDNWYFGNGSWGDILSSCTSWNGNYNGLTIDVGAGNPGGQHFIQMEFWLCANDYVHLASGQNCTIRGAVAGGTGGGTGPALSIINVLSGITGMDVEMSYYPAGFTSGAVPIIGAGRLDSSNRLIARNGMLGLQALPNEAAQVTVIGRFVIPFGARYFYDQNGSTRGPSVVVLTVT